VNCEISLVSFHHNSLVLDSVAVVDPCHLLGLHRQRVDPWPLLRRPEEEHETC
jgi:hypothetical protein